MKDYKIQLRAIVIGETFVAAPSKREAVATFRAESEHAVEQVTKVEKYKILKVEET